MRVVINALLGLLRVSVVRLVVALLVVGTMLQGIFVPAEPIARDRTSFAEVDDGPSDRFPSAVKDKDCSDFSSHDEAQAFFEEDDTNAHYLDGDGDGIACERLLR